MPFAQKLAAGSFPVALEITPPQKPLSKVLLRRAGLLGEAACAINVIQRPGRQSSLEASLELAAAGFHPAWHLVTRGRSREELEADLAVAAKGGISQVLCIRGDHPGADSPGAPNIREVVGMVRSAMPEAIVGATLNQYGRDKDAVLRNLLPKLKAGASYVQTQPVFDPAPLEEMVERIRESIPEARVVAMAMPLLSVDAAEKIEARLGFALPASLHARFSAGGDPWEAFDELIARLAESKHVDGVAVMTFEMDAGNDVGLRIVDSLRRAGISP